MDPKTYEINRLNVLNECLTETIAVLARCSRIGLPTGGMGVSHTQFGPGIFGMQGMPVDPRSVVDYNNAGFSHSSPYGVYPFGYDTRSIAGWPGAQSNVPQTFVDPFLGNRGLTHTGLPGSAWTTVSPYAAEIERQRQFQALLAQQQYNAMWQGRFGV